MTAYLDAMPQARHDRIRQLLTDIRQGLARQRKGFARYRELMANVAHLRAAFADFSGRAVIIGDADELTPADQEILHATMRAFMPWRKGPFRIFGIDIDAEWQSWRKWDRIAAHLPDLAGKVVADIGCNNGYYMFRMLPHQPRLVLGFEPYLQHYCCLETLKALSGRTELFVEPLGVEHIGLFPATFDVVFLLGILYHRPSPIEVLKDIRAAMKPGGWLIVESQAIPGDEPVALFPEIRYAKVPGTYFIPTAACLHNWLVRAGFSEITCFCSHPMTSDEQRRTDWMVFESYADFLDPADPTRTIEGYPAPLRIFFKARAS